ncbi:MAG TPA: Gfo/Idh/MocA family oxidoreductase [Victivallales bacterium]|nr:Gfo/Idh/MocA family oxidoreductase [Victivallales bacterium]HRR06726.1 Gfo/Idh/MocA family oxidoreductase [Victivallales bacterium]HRR29195.1 Gfo/Idh/MocA family oxidoreductase [Victivallales bacterium]
MSKLKIAFAGVGNMGQCAHLRNFATLKNLCEVSAISDPRIKTAKAVAARYNIPNVYQDALEMIEKEDIDAIVASQPFTRHGVLIPELLKARVPIFIEKPLSSNIESGEKILKAIKDSGTWIMVGYHKRSDPAAMFAKKEILKLKASKEIGKIKYLRITMPPGDWVANGFFDLIKEDEYQNNFQSEPAPTDMNTETFKKYTTFVNYYIHQINLAKYLLDEKYNISYADPDEILLVGKTNSNITISIEMAPYSTSIDWQESAIVCFERGWVRLDIQAPLRINIPGKIEIFKDPGNEKIPERIIPQMPSIHPMRQQAINFISAVKGEIPPICDAEEALDDLKIARQYLKLLTGK